jgi:hypothetical protein
MTMDPDEDLLENVFSLPLVRDTTPDESQQPATVLLPNGLKIR